MALTNIPVTIGKGGLSKVIAKIGESSDLSTGLYFGYDKDLGAGVVVAGGRVVSSKILNLTATDEASTGVKTIEVTYLDTTSATGKNTTSFEVVSYEGVKSVIDSIITDDLIDASTANGAVTITPVTGADGNTKYAISVNVDGNSVIVNGDGNLAVDTYKLKKTEDSLVNADNAAEYVFTTSHANGDADTTVTIEIPKAKAIQTAGLVKYEEGSQLTDEQKAYVTGQGETVNDSSIYVINLDTNPNTVTAIDELPTNTETGETYIHFVWANDGGETNMAASELAVNYTGSDYITVEDHVISLNYDELTNKLVSDYGIDKVNDIDASLSDVSTRVSALEELVSGTGADSIQSRLNTLDSSVAEDEEKIAALDASVAEDEEKIAALDASVAEDEEKIAALDASIADDEEKIAALDTSVADDEKKIAALDASVATNADAITNINTEITNIYNKLTWVDLDA